jgi:hypothetical protein
MGARPGEVVDMLSIGALWGYGELFGVHCIGCLEIACLVDAVIRSILWIRYERGIAI